MATSTQNNIDTLCSLMEIIDLWGKQALQKQMDSEGHEENWSEEYNGSCWCFVGKEGLSEKVTIIRDGAGFHWGVKRDYWWRYWGKQGLNHYSVSDT